MSHGCLWVIPRPVSQGVRARTDARRLPRRPPAVWCGGRLTNDDYYAFLAPCLCAIISANLCQLADADAPVVIVVVVLLLQCEIPEAVKSTVGSDFGSV